MRSSTSTNPMHAAFVERSRVLLRAVGAVVCVAFVGTPTARAQVTVTVPLSAPTAPQVAPTAPQASAPVLPRFAAPAEQFSFAPREQIKLDITITAAPDLNPDEKERPAPILVRVYELRSEAVFETADYFSLQNSDKAVIGADLLTREEFILRPGDVKTIRRKSHPDVGAIAVLAGYRDLAQSDWRAVQKIAPAPEAAWYRAAWPANKSKLQIQLQSRGVRITPVE
ncbi:type VI secretion system lipoprotein TssJ [Variovorax sp. H27-G14]|uniref:type VI secretion system lipoprotein TssJ n=1 Tax=Variovorax sp. H27-G14 TaxID=3111914 RepID=UPI0038FD25CE